MFDKFLRKIIAVAGIQIPDAVAANEPVSLGQLNAAISAAMAGLDWTRSYATVATSNIALTGLFAINGYTPSAGDAIAVVGQTDPTENGPWVAAAGAWTRAAWADSSAELTTNFVMPIDQGDHAGKVWRLTTTGPITVGTTALTFTQWTLGATYSGTAGVTVTGSVIALDDAVAVRKGSALIGDGTNSSFVVNHALNTQKLIGVTLREVATGEFVGAKIVATSTTSITVTFDASIIPTTNQYELSFAA
ncbi:MAG: head decoration protein [Methylococcaceae bacterium]|nr:MAG: head decoration protein [Methylococcaceae bacterium]